MGGFFEWDLALVKSERFLGFSMSRLPHLFKFSSGFGLAVLINFHLSAL
jgi:hypothetical protein